MSWRMNVRQRAAKQAAKLSIQEQLNPRRKTTVPMKRCDSSPEIIELGK